MQAPFKRKNGFTVIELLVSISIITVITTIIALRQSAYTDVVSLVNTADKIASAVSEAQAYSVGVREFVPGSNNFSVGYGLHFQSAGAGGANDSYILWADITNNYIYDSGWACPTGGSSECLQKVFFENGNTVNRLCYINNGGNNVCNNIGGIAVSFRRPATTAEIRFFNNSGNYINPQPNNIGAAIELVSPKGVLKEIKIRPTGIVSVE